MVSTLAGCASTLFSLTRDAAVYWARMKPELVPASGARNGGRPRENAGSSIRSTRRSLMLASSDMAMPSMSAAKASDPPGVVQDVADGAVDLGGAAQAVGVLDGVPAVPVAGHQARAGQEGAQVGGAVELARVRADDLDAQVVGAVGAEQRLDGHGAGHVGGLDEEPGVLDGEG